MKEVAIVQNEVGDIMAVLPTAPQAEVWIQDYIVQWIGYEKGTEYYQRARDDYTIITMPIEYYYTPR